MIRSIIARRRVAVMTALLFTCPCILQMGMAQADPLADYPALDISVTGNSVDLKPEVEAGYYRLAIENRSEVEPDISIVRLREGTTVDEVLAAVEQVELSFSGQAHPGQAMARIDSLADAIGGQSIPSGAVIELTSGDYLVFSLNTTGNGPGHTSLGLYQPLTVTGSADELTPPQADVVIRMVDFAFALPADIPSGVQTWQVVNVGEQIHHMILMRLDEGTNMEDVTAFFQGPPSGPPPFREVGYINVLSTDESNYLTFDLGPGNYVAICFMPDYETGRPHAMLGMIQGFSIGGE